MSVRDARMYTCKRVLYTIMYIVYTFTKLHDRRIPNVGVRVRVGVGPMEFQLNGQGVALRVERSRVRLPAVALLGSKLATLDKLFLHTFASVTKQYNLVAMSCGWEGNRRSGVALVMRHGNFST